MALRFPFAEFSHTPDGCPSDRVMDEGHSRRNKLRTNTGGAGGISTHVLPLNRRKLYAAKLRPRWYIQPKKITPIALNFLDRFYGWKDTEFA